MAKKNDGLGTVEIIRDIDTSISVTTSPTLIIEESEELYPYCVLPEHFFEFALSRQSRGKETTLLSIDSWDGREILSVIKRH